MTVKKDEENRLKELQNSIDDAKKRLNDPTNFGEGTKSNEGIAIVYKICIELIAGVTVGSVTGYYFDVWLGTKPWLFIICFFLGVAGSALNIYKGIKFNKEL